MARSIAIFSVFIVAVGVAFFTRCGGPAPLVRDVQLERTARGWTVRADVVNTARGHGQVEVIVRLRAAGGIVRQDVQRVEIDASERVRVSAAFEEPDGHYVAEVEARYPPL